MTKTILISLEQDELRRIITEAAKTALQEHNSVRRQDQFPDSNVLLKIHEVAKLLSVSKVTIHDWKRKGIIPFHRMGGRVFFKKQEVIQALKKVIINK